jgi:V/A-type H+-transporting ATPase subunit E
MEENPKTLSGVQELIERIRDQGVQAAQQEADHLLRDARKQAATIVDQAKAEADAMLRQARAEIEAHRTAALDALQLAARDAVLDLKARVMARFEQFVKRLVVSATCDKELVRDIVLVLAGHAAEELVKDKEIHVRISSALLEGATGPVLQEEGKLAILGLASDMLREGLELVSDREIQGGARVQLVKDKLEIDLSDRAVSRMIAQRMLPRFKAILEGVE